MMEGVPGWSRCPGCGVWCNGLTGLNPGAECSRCDPEGTTIYVPGEKDDRLAAAPATTSPDMSGRAGLPTVTDDGLELRTVWVH